MSKPIIDPLFAEWWKKSNLVVTSNQQREDVKVAFHCGIHVALGLVARSNKMSQADAILFVRQMMAECDAILKPTKIKPPIANN